MVCKRIGSIVLASAAVLALRGGPAMAQPAAPLPPLPGPRPPTTSAAPSRRFATDPLGLWRGASRRTAQHSPSFPASGSPQVWTMALDGAAPVQRTRLADPVQDVYWSPAGGWLAYDVAPGGGLNTQIYVMRPDGSGARRLTAGGRENNWLFGWTRDGRRLRIGSNAANPGGVDAMLMDPATGATTRIASGGLNVITDVSRDGRHAIVSRLVSRGNDNLHLVDLQSGRKPC